ncbi:TetR/AcrR family transcriptional regulator [Phaeobacter marinintestinus]|uniref:TetR/AcrR family transcriptional regulator n=1 Tax=Falsiphaeobacter marinintestinus TaxID=1492905 RepID=UPI0011B67ABE|nr:TetR/AcrR family transcriptional regulator [Phaeobacter marinintestinus]
MKQSRDIIRKGRKFDQVLAGAREIFLVDGFEGASVDDIAKAAAVSKATLYSYFPDKRQLFMEVARNECDLMAARAMHIVDDDMPVRDILLSTARELTAFLISDFAQAIFRVCVAERDRFPELGHAFYECGPAMGQQRISEFLTCAVERGQLVIKDIPMAAEQFAELCKVKLWTRAAFGVQTSFTAEEIEDVAQNAVETFMARYGR